MLSTRLISSFCLLFLLFLPSITYAQNDIDSEQPGLKIQPAIIDISGQPGSVINSTIKITNTFNKPLGFSARAQTLAPNDKPIDISAVDKYDASRWVNFPTKDFLLDGLASVEVELEVTVPVDAVPGGHYALSIFRLETTDLEDSSGVKINREAGAVMLISVPGVIVEDAEIATNSATTLAFGGESVIKQTISNTGNLHILPIITTEIRDGSTVIDTVTQPLQLLLPNTKRDIEVKWQSKGGFKRYQLVTTVSFGTPNQSIASSAGSTIFLPSAWTLILWTLIVFTAIRFMYRLARKKSVKFKRFSDHLIANLKQIRRKFAGKIMHVFKTIVPLFTS